MDEFQFHPNDYITAESTFTGFTSGQFHFKFNFTGEWDWGELWGKVKPFSLLVQTETGEEYLGNEFVHNWDHVGDPEYDFEFKERFDVLEIPNTGSGEIPYIDIGAYEYAPETTSVEPPDGPNISETYMLEQNYPNPFNATTRINFSILSGNWAELEIFNVAGRRIYHRKFDGLKVGRKSMLWDGRDGKGSIVSSGVYVCRVRQMLGSRAIKMVLIR